MASAQYYRRLAASDFQGVPSAGNQALAYTDCDVKYTYQATGRNNSYSVDFNVQLVFNRDKSFIHLNWIKDQDMLLQVLRHEQGHYNIAYLMRAELYRAFRQAHYTANYAQEIGAIFRQVDAKYQKINADYERQTMHMQNDIKQEEWNAWFSRAIDNAPVRGSALAER
ncbi:hypothetical protein BEL04_20835 [Mucilaginibacter sp. PPCGB 2223]|nr:hypothetical protein BEL04_20835 [Mucilaginibacter sp. PPCGB 2223]